MGISIGVVVDHPSEEADDGKGDEGGVGVPTAEEARDGPIDLLDNSGHG